MRESSLPCLAEKSVRGKTDIIAELSFPKLMELYRGEENQGRAEEGV